jgi:hypothetical protein
MGIDILLAIASGIVSLAVGKTTALGLLEKLARKLGEPVIRRIFGKKEAAESYSSRVSALVETLDKTSSDMDTVLAELASVAKQRSEALKTLEADLQAMEKKEAETKQRIELLASVPIPVADRFAELASVGEKRSARRDYVLFAAGVAVSTIVAIAIELVKGGLTSR